jgi:hypothetical protein
MQKKQIYLLLFFGFSVFQSFAQTNAPFAIEGKIRAVLATDSQKENGRLTDGGEISFSSVQGMATNVIVKYGKVGKAVTTIDQTDSMANGEVYIQVFEYDFDQDGKQELGIAYRNNDLQFKVEIYRYSGGLTELVGNFDGQMHCEIMKNRIQFEYGMQGIVQEYLYENGIFFELVVHDPTKKEPTGQ